MFISTNSIGVMYFIALKYVAAQYIGRGNDATKLVVFVKAWKDKSNICL